MAFIKLLEKRAFTEKQQGVILLLFIIGLFLVSSTLFLTVLNNNMSTLQSEENVTEALIEAKERLIAFAILSEDHFPGNTGPGHLFCPDTNGDGLPDSPCATAALGRLPGSVTTALGSIPISNFNAGIDEQFWFSLGAPLRSSPATALNSSSASNITIDGMSGIAAVLIAPGEALNSQSRPNNTVSNYLEASNTSAPVFVSRDSSAPAGFNDRVLRIEMTEIMTPVTSRVTGTIKGLLDSYHSSNGFYPDDSSFGTTVMAGAPSWFDSNGWLAQTNYVRLNTDSATLVFNGCGITYTVSATANTTRDARQC